MHLGGSANIIFTVLDPSMGQIDQAELRHLTIGGRSAFRKEGIGAGGDWFSENGVFCPSYMIIIQYSNPGRDDAYEALYQEVLDSFECK